MNNNPTSNIVSVLKQKMTDTRDEVAKYKEKILDLENSMQAEVDRKEIATTEACRLNERMAVLEEKLAEVKDATRTANEKTAELSKTGESAEEYNQRRGREAESAGGRVEESSTSGEGIFPEVWWSLKENPSYWK